MLAQAASTVQTNQSPGLFMLARGVLASAFGRALVTNFRGFAGNFARRARASEKGLEPVVRLLAMFSPAIRRGGWRLASALISSAGVLLVGIGIATGQLTIAIAAWVIGGLSTVVLMMGDKPAG